jgi:ADP-heptose:LPS heptosyltransferase
LYNLYTHDGQRKSISGAIELNGSRETAVRGEALFLRLRLLGDIVFTIPAVTLFKERLPATRLYYAVEERFAEAAGIIPGIDGVITVPSRPGPGDVLAFRRRLRRLGVDTVIDLHSGPTAALLTRASGAAVRAGFRTANRNWAYNRMVERFDPARPAHSVHNQARLLEAVGIDGAEPPPYPALPASAFAVTPRLEPLVALRPKAVLHLGAGNRFRDWGEEHFAELAQRLTAEGVAVVLVGGSEAERLRGARLGRLQNVHDLTGPLALRELLALVASAAVYVGADSGPLHAASLTATPLVALYGPNLTAVSGPWRRDRLAVVESDLACRPCSQRRCKYGTIPCMRDISTDRVHDAARQFIR